MGMTEETASEKPSERTHDQDLSVMVESENMKDEDAKEAGDEVTKECEEREGCQDVGTEKDVDTEVQSVSEEEEVKSVEDEVQAVEAKNEAEDVARAMQEEVK